MNRDNLIKYGFGEGRYRVMGDPKVAEFFMECGWKPKYDMEQRQTEIARRMADGLTEDEAQWDVDEEIQSDLELFTALRFAKVSAMS